MKRNVSNIIRALLWVLLFVLTALAGLFFIPPEPQQVLLTEPPSSPISSLADRAFNLDSLQVLYGANKVLAPGYELQCLLALSAFPDLKKTQIEFLLLEEGAPMESSFDYLSLMGNENSRRYQILLNNSYDQTFLEPILLRNLPFDAQVGILAHELGHTRYYRQLSAIKIISWALNYALRPSYRSAHERSTDVLVVYQGMGWQLLEYAEFVRYNATTKDLYLKGKVFMDTFYLTPREIVRTMNQSGLYK